MRTVLLPALIGLLSACGERPATLEDLNATEVIFPNGAKIMAETMRGQVELLRGMMFRDSLANDRGMLLAYPREGNYPCWMFQTRIPLDVIWIDRPQRTLELAAATPPWR